MTCQHYDCVVIYELVTPSPVRNHVIKNKIFFAHFRAFHFLITVQGGTGILKRKFFCPLQLTYIS